MKKESFKVGQRVGCGLNDNWEFTDEILYTDDDDNVALGVIKEIVSDDEVLVLWDDETLNKRTGKIEEVLPAPINPNLLLSEQDVKEKLAESEEKIKAVSDEIKAKLTAAGNLIKEANAIAKNVGLSVADMDESDVLVRAMDLSG
jgi:hypothetical protein